MKSFDENDDENDLDCYNSLCFLGGYAAGLDISTTEAANEAKLAVLSDGDFIRKYCSGIDIRHERLMK